MAFFVQNFRGEVLRCPTERISLRVVLNNLCEPKISKFYIPVLVHQNVLRLEISVDDMFLVEMADGKRYLR